MSISSAEPVAVRHTEGLEFGFLTLKTLDGYTIADGEMSQVAQKDRVTNRITFQFKDGSVRDETTVFSQSGTFRLISNHLIQRGPSFKRPMDTFIDASSGEVTVRYTEEDGKEKAMTERMELPADIANGLVLTLLKDIDPGAQSLTVSMVAATPKPRLIRLVISSRGDEPFSAGSLSRKATHYVVKVEIGGVAGVVAPIVGKQPPDTHVWVLGGAAPAFIKSEGPLFEGGPSWRIQLANAAVFAGSSAAKVKKVK